MYNVGWYARDGHVDLFPLIANNLIRQGMRIESFYICHNDYDKEHLKSTYGIRESFALGHFIRENVNKVDVSYRTIKTLEENYNAMPLVRGLWSSMFEHDLPEETMVRLFISHIEGWKYFLEKNKIKVLFSEVPSIMSTIAAWLVCKNLDIDFVSFVNIPPLDSRMILSSSWQGYYDRFEEDLNKIEVNKDSIYYANALQYVSKMKNNPQKTQDAKYFMDVVQKQNKKLPLDLEKLLGMNSYWRLHKKKRQYYIHENIKRILFRKIKYNINPTLYTINKIFENPDRMEKERYFLLPLHMFNEYSNYTWMGTHYGNQADIVKKISLCLPIGCYLYVKEHTSQFGEKPCSFYKEIKQCRGVRVISPYADTFKLIRNSAGIITLGSTVGFEAFMMDRRVIVLGKPWYRNFPGVYQAEEAEVLSELLQNVDSLRTASDDEKIKILYALYETSFEGSVYMPHLLSPQNINNLASVFKKRIEDGARHVLHPGISEYKEELTCS